MQLQEDLDGEHSGEGEADRGEDGLDGHGPPHTGGRGAARPWRHRRWHGANGNPTGYRAAIMGQAITVTEKPTGREGITRFELDRVLTGM
ncbi:MAG TPA: hypothetical protein VKQ71_02615, partial [Acidimicrobiales bacterium]|nr:hypothetical protein [Acidimicrobiales bacterium]